MFHLLLLLLWLQPKYCVNTSVARVVVCVMFLSSQAALGLCELGPKRDLWQHNLSVFSHPLRSVFWALLSGGGTAAIWQKCHPKLGFGSVRRTDCRYDHWSIVVPEEKCSVIFLDRARPCGVMYVRRHRGGPPPQPWSPLTWPHPLLGATLSRDNVVGDGARPSRWLSALVALGILCSLCLKVWKWSRVAQSGRRLFCGCWRCYVVIVFVIPVQFTCACLLRIRLWFAGMCIN